MKQQIQLFLVKGASAPTVTLAVEMEPTAANPDLPTGLLQFLRAVLSHAVAGKPLGYRVAHSTGPVDVPAAGEEATAP